MFWNDLSVEMWNCLYRRLLKTVQTICNVLDVVNITLVQKGRVGE